MESIYTILLLIPTFIVYGLGIALAILAVNAC